MKKVFLAVFCVMLFLGNNTSFAQEENLQKKQSSIEKLKVEFRLRVQAKRLVTDLGLFDETGLLVRGITDTQIQDTQENTLGPDVGRFPDFSSTPSTSALTEVSTGQELSLEGLGDGDLGDQSLQEILNEIEVLSQQGKGRK